MKRLFFSAIAVMAVVSSALAYTALPTSLFLDDPDTAGLQCTEQTFFISDQPTGPSLGTVDYDDNINPSGCEFRDEIFENE